ncbi:MAG: CBS domain-containing protein [Candidatus Anaerobiospirillum merdipullorum]|uniref:CBS domain-containing protein n=1 Tax=Candidatus Anaerobiospirillum merdipullorum TaxID=2838450 RepID=A0A9E2KP85_9GAMM|nr:CBS domain-containing protein [Candidatus Anaerobiospirillum merdipullorum]
MDAVAAHHVMFDMAWVSDPTAWLGLLTLVVIEIVLGIDNLVFIAILSAKLPTKRLRDKARYTGLGGALLIRLVLLTFISYIVTFTTPLFHIGSFAVSGRDLVMMVGGLFLLYKATHELHAKLEGFDEELSVSKAAGSAFWLVVLQIMVLDAVFSLDAIITAVGMIDHVFIMMFAVIIAMGIMTLASRAITEFVSHHPTLVILCLGFLLLIGFSLIMEALHFHVPKGYLYAAIGFSILIEIFNQVARKNTLKLGSGVNAMQSREVAANLVLRLLGSNQTQVQTFKEAIVSKTGSHVFDFEEKEMVSRVLQLSSMPIKAVMTARTDVEMLDIAQSVADITADVRKLLRSRVVVYKNGQKDQPLGYVRRVDMLSRLLDTKNNTTIGDLSNLIYEPLYLPETISILKALEEFRKKKAALGFVIDEFGNFEGVISLHDIMEEIAGELPERTEVPELVRVSPGVYRIAGDAILKDVSRLTGFKVPPSDNYHTLAGFILDYLQRMPLQGEVISFAKWTLTIVKVSETSVVEVELKSLTKTPEKKTKR